MISMIGSFLTGFAALIALYAAIAAWIGQSRNENSWKESSEHAGLAVLVMLFMAVVFLVGALITGHYEISYVYNHSANALPLYLKITALWGGQEGSLLFWSFMQALFSLIAIRTQKVKNEESVSIAAVVLKLILFFFAGITFLFQNPFSALSQVPPDGLGLNPLLRHPAMAFHPPALYIGFVGLSVPFAFAIAAMISGRYSSWRQPLHQWAILSWFGLGLGLILGMRWAYVVLGWGGYWGWDAVENAALMPWLITTALVHSHFRGEPSGENSSERTFILASAAYLLVIFGTFATRSGMIQSVHAYTQSSIGIILLIAMLVILAAAIYIFFRYRNSQMLSRDGKITLRSGIFKLTTLILITLTLSVFIGTILPTLSELFSGNVISITSAWFELVTGPQFAFLVLLMGVCPLAIVALKGLGKWPVVVISVAAGVLMAVLFSYLLGRFEILPLMVFTLIGFSLISEIIKYIRRGGTNGGRQKFSNYKYVSSLMIHMGLILLALGVFGSKAYESEDYQTVNVNSSINVQNYRLEYLGFDQEVQADTIDNIAHLNLYKNGKLLGEITPVLTQYDNGQTSLSHPAIHPSIANDFYVILAGWEDNGAQAAFQIYISPLINFMWFGGILLLAGGYIAMKPKFGHRVWKYVYWIIGVFILILIVWLMWGSPFIGTSTQAARLSVGSDAPAINQLADINGIPVSPEGYSSGITIVNFWAPWCPSCRDELPDLEKIWNENKDKGVNLVGITYESDETSINTAIDLYGITYPIAMDPGSEVSSQFFVTGVPETYIVDSNGKVVFVAIGATTYDQLSKEVMQLSGQVQEGS